MGDRRYLLSIKELLEGLEAEKLAERACAKLDKERLGKVQGCARDRKRVECIGTGLLLQLGLQEFMSETAYSSGGEVTKTCMCDVVTDAEDRVQFFSVSQILERLDAPVEPGYTYGEKGKPYFQEIPIYFNLSHSGDYVFCVFSKQEVGVDIQYKKPNVNDRVVKRFFTEAEQEVWESCSTQEERKHLFYRLWTRKEAYGKLTGEGIIAATAVNVLDTVSENNHDCAGKRMPGVFWEDYEILDNYQISVCKQAGKKE